MKQINVWFEDKEHDMIYKIKNKHGGNWHDFLLDAIKRYKEVFENEFGKQRTDKGTSNS